MIAGGSVTLQVPGGARPNVTQWIGDAQPGFSVSVVPVLNSAPIISSTKSAKGTYALEVSDRNGGNVSFMVVVKPPES
jgi:hypothetical protein